MALLLIWLRKSCKHVWWPSERIHCELPHVEGFSWWWKMLPGWTRHKPSAFGDMPCASHLRPPRRRISLKPRPAMTGNHWDNIQDPSRIWWISVIESTPHFWGEKVCFLPSTPTYGEQQLLHYQGLACSGHCAQKYVCNSKMPVEMKQP